VARLLLLPAAGGALAVVPLLFASWFAAGQTFAAVYGRNGVVLEPTAWNASSSLAAALVLLAALTAGAAVAAARGRFVAWTVGATSAVLGALLCLVLRASPPDPGAVYVSPGAAYDPTTAPIAAMACFLVAAASLTAWALVTQRRR
jgi:hypothetical protein